jgi:hypothetical protein
MAAAHKGKASAVTQFLTAAEDSDVPVACDRCLGSNGLIRVTKEANKRKCAVCQRPTAVFTWTCDGKWQKKTSICAGCANKSNKCQACLGMLKPQAAAAAAAARKHDRADGDGYERKTEVATAAATATATATGADKKVAPSGSKAQQQQQAKAAEKKPQKAAGGFAFDWMSAIE